MVWGLKDRVFRLAVFSDRLNAFGRLELDETGVAEFLDYALFMVDGRPNNPDPQGLGKVMAAIEWRRRMPNPRETGGKAWSAPTGPGPKAAPPCVGLWTRFLTLWML